MSVPKQGGVLNYLGETQEVNAPRFWQSSPTSPPEEPTPKRTVLPPPGEPLGQQLALELLCQGIRMAQSRGTYKLEESAIFLRAINEFVVKKPSS